VSDAESWEGTMARIEADMKRRLETATPEVIAWVMEQRPFLRNSMEPGWAERYSRAAEEGVRRFPHCTCIGLLLLGY
jgi:hypothetical protein